MRLASQYLQNFLSTIWYIRPGAYSLLESLSFRPSGMKVSLKQTKNNKQGKLFKSSTPGLRDHYRILLCSIANVRKSRINHTLESWNPTGGVLLTRILIWIYLPMEWLFLARNHPAPINKMNNRLKFEQESSYDRIKIVNVHEKR